MKQSHLSFCCWPVDRVAGYGKICPRPHLTMYEARSAGRDAHWILRSCKLSRRGQTLIMHALAASQNAVQTLRSRSMMLHQNLGCANPWFAASSASFGMETHAVRLSEGWTTVTGQIRQQASKRRIRISFSTTQRHPVSACHDAAADSAGSKRRLAGLEPSRTTVQTS